MEFDGDESKAWSQINENEVVYWELAETLLG